MIRKDDRTAEQHKTHRFAVVGTDRFLSGWGEAENMASYAAWAYADYDTGRRVESWVRARPDMERVRVVDLSTYRPKGQVHLHIYVVNNGHPSTK